MVASELRNLDMTPFRSPDPRYASTTGDGDAFLARAVIDAAFATHADLNRIHARADERNRASRRVMEKVGMVKDGVLRMSRIERGEAVDEAWFAILRTEWST